MEAKEFTIKLIKELLSGKADGEKRQRLIQSSIIEKELKNQWEEAKNEPVSPQIGTRIWKSIKKNSVERRTTSTFHLRLLQTAASVAVLLAFGGGLWLFLDHTPQTFEEYITFTAQGNNIYTLPDSSRVYMQQGSSIRFAREFSKDRSVWLSGESLFEVQKQNGKHFKVHIDKAYIDVKGTTFLVKQYTGKKSETILLSGKIEFNVEETGSKIVMKPSQKIIYDPITARTTLQDTENVTWKNGRFHFTRINLSTLIRTINQIYDSNIIVDKEVNINPEFTGSIRYDESLKDVIDKICYSLNLKQEESSRGIIIHN